MAKLFYAYSDDPCALLSFDQQPVIPVTSDRTKCVIERLADIHKAELLKVNEPDTCLPRAWDGRKGSVCAVSPDTLPEAQLFAHLLGRQLFSLDEALANTHRSLAVIGHFDDWDATLIDRVTPPSGIGQPQPVGFILGEKNRLVDNVIKYAVASWSSVKRSCCTARVMPHFHLNFIGLDGMFLTGSQVTDENIRAMLASNLDVLQITGHGNSVDLTLSDRHVLCSQLALFKPDQEGQAPPGRHPICVLSGSCYKECFPTSQTERRSIRRLNPREVCAKVLVIDSCDIMHVHDGMLDPASGIGRQLISDAYTGALLTNADIAYTSNYSQSRLLAAIDQGMPVGLAVCYFNGDPASVNLHRRLHVFGDPEFTLGPRWKPWTRQQNLIMSQGYRDFNAESSPKPRTELLSGFLPNLCFDLFATKTYYAEQKDRTKTLLDDIWAAQPPIGRAQVELIAEFLGNAPSIKVWINSAGMTAAHDFEANCFVCDSPLKVFRGKPAYSRHERYTATCTCCGELLDVEDLNQIRLRLGSDAILHLNLDDRAVEQYVLVRSTADNSRTPQLSHYGWTQPGEHMQVDLRDHVNADKRVMTFITLLLVNSSSYSSVRIEARVTKTTDAIRVETPRRRALVE